MRPLQRRNRERPRKAAPVHDVTEGADIDLDQNAGVGQGKPLNLHIMLSVTGFQEGTGVALASTHWVKLHQEWENQP